MQTYHSLIFFLHEISFVAPTSAKAKSNSIAANPPTPSIHIFGKTPQEIKQSSIIARRARPACAEAIAASHPSQSQGTFLGFIETPYLPTVYRGFRKYSRESCLALLANKNGATCGRAIDQAFPEDRYGSLLPVTRFTMRTRTAATRRRWMSDPATWKVNPRSHRTRRIANRVHNMGVSPPFYCGSITQKTRLWQAYITSIFYWLSGLCNDVRTSFQSATERIFIPCLSAETVTLH